MSALKSVQLRGLVATLGLLVALTIALTIPAGYGIMAYQKEADALQFRAELNATRLAKYASGHPEAWYVHTARLTQILDLSEWRQDETRQRILDRAGKVLAEQGETARPSLTRSAPILLGGVQVGTVEAEMSLIALLRTGAFVLLFSTSLGFSVFMTLRAFPMRALDQALGELEHANAATKLAYDELQHHHRTLLEREEEIGKQNLRFDAALNNMSQGLSMFDSEGQLIVCNPRYLEIYRFSSEVVRPGVSYRRVLEHGTEVGNHSAARFHQLYAAKIAQICEARAENYFATLDNGRVVAISHRPMADGGWVATHDDVTEAKHAEAQIEQQNAMLRQREDELEIRNTQFDAALNNMSQGLMMLGPDRRLLVCNRRYLEMYGFSRERVRPGISFRELLEYSISLGRHRPGVTPDDLIAAYEARNACGERTTSLRELQDGRIISISHEPMPNGGSVQTFDDITERKRVEEQIRQQNEMLREREDQLSAQNLWFDAALNNMSLGLCMFDGEQRLIVSNKRFVDMYRVSADLMRPGTTLEEIVRHRYEAGSGPKQAQEAYLAERSAITANGALSHSVVELRDGRAFAIAHQPMPDGGWVATHEDITERQEAEAKIQEQNQALRDREDQLRTQNLRFDAALNNMSQGLALFDAEQRLTVCNARYIEIFGFSADFVRPGISYRAILEHSATLGNHDPKDVDRIVEQKHIIVRERQVESYHLDLQDGRVIAISHQPMEDGGWVATYEDVTERKQAEARITHMARHDALTDLPNRLLFRERMEEALGRVRQGEQIAVLCLDLDNFKAVNDTLGHPVGDALLRAVAERIRSVLRDGDEVARFGGDEFAVLQRGVESPEDASELARRLVEVVGRPYVLDGHQMNVGVSLGIAVAPGDGQDPDHLLKSADMALYRAKADGRATFRFFEPDMDARVQARRALEIDLRQALVKREFELCFQPLVNLARGEVSGFEALVRWHHPERGMVSPADFIPVAEEIGMIAPLGEWVLRRACAEAASWPGDIKIAVNLSPLQFRTGSLVQVVMSALASSGLAANRLELEITETVLLDRSEANLATLHQLRGLGVRISMDDFGTGYSSLSYLRSFPFDKIKIDRSFVQEIQVNPDCASIIRAIASLGLSLGMTTTAEGVETREQMELIRAEGITEVQGYYYSPPKPASEVAGLLARIDGTAERAA